jgi:hypothetical protein
VRFQEINPHQAITKSKSSQLLLLLYSEGGKNIRDPPEPETSFFLLPDFNKEHMGAKSNNLKILQDGLGSSVHLPKSGCIPFKMQEYTLDLHPSIKTELNDLIKKLSKTKSYKRMNKMLYKCKDLVMQLEFVASDPKLAHVKKSLI